MLDWPSAKISLSTTLPIKFPYIIICSILTVKPNLTLLEFTGFLCGFIKDSDRILLSWNSKTFSYIDKLSNQNRWYMNMIWLSGTCLYQPISLNDTSTIYPYSLFSLLKCSSTYWRWWEFIFLVSTTHFSFTSHTSPSITSIPEQCLLYLFRAYNCSLLKRLHKNKKVKNRKLVVD